jgi:hypothetical protein
MTSKTVYEVWGSYSPAQHRDECLDEFTTREEAEEYVEDFEKVSGRSAYMLRNCHITKEN